MSNETRMCGDCAKLREAVKAALDKLLLWNYTDRDTARMALEVMNRLNAALAEPVRNCDRFDDLNSAQRNYIEHGCPKGLGKIVDGEIRKFPWKSQFEKWLFAPATEQEGGAK